MSNLAEELEAAADGPILFAVIGSDNPDEDPIIGDPIPWSEARAVLDYDYDHEGCFTLIEDVDKSGFPHAVYAWTEHRVLFVAEYDGSTRVEWVPRNPIICAPEFV